MRWIFGSLSAALGLAVAASAAPAGAAPAGSGAACGDRGVPGPICSYFSAMESIFRRGSTADDVERLFELVTDDVRYVHETYDAAFEHGAWREAFLRNVESAAYGEPADFCFRITNYIPGNGFAAVEYEYGHEDAGTCVSRQDGRKLVLFETREGKIRLIQELW